MKGPVPAAVRDPWLPEDPLVQELLPVLGTGMNLGLERTLELLRRLGDPHRAVPSIHVAGTNGKGSTAALVAAALQAGGFRVGLHTSPHLVAVGERFLLEGRPAPERALRAAAEPVAAAARDLLPSFFEASTALAFELFRRERMDVMVVETGLGGRLDATNVLTPLASGVTGVARDHEEHLGTSLAGIAREKAGIAKAGVPFLTTEPELALRAVLEGEALSHGARVLGIPDSLLEVEGLEGGHARCRLGWGSSPPRSVTLALAGAHQVRSARLALGLLDAVQDRFPVTADAAARALTELWWPGRLDRREIGGRSWLFDMAHNAEAVLALVAALPSLKLPPPITGVVGILADKPWREMLESLLPVLDRVIPVVPQSAPSARRWDPGEVMVWLARRSDGPPVAMPPESSWALDGVVRNLRGPSSDPPGSVVVTGSTHTVGDGFKALEIVPFPPGFGLLRGPANG